VVEQLLRGAGYQLVEVADPHLCCGSAGTYSLLEPELSERLRDQKVAALRVGRPQVIATANIGCQLHLAGAAGVPVRHWLELLR
jgi:glycolate oxidase iron-sulfur subunit